MVDITSMMALKVQPFDMGRYWVTSSKGKRQYLVDLLENNGRGRCSCPDFEINQNPMCKHIVRCWVWLARGVLERLAANEREK